MENNQFKGIKPLNEAEPEVSYLIYNFDKLIK